MELLPEWNGKVVGVMHRMYMTKKALAAEMGVARTYASKVINSPAQTAETRAKVEAALESFARSRSVYFNDLWRPEDRTRTP